MPITYSQQMTDAEGLMWRMENDPYLSSNIVNVSILDRNPDWDLFRQRMQRAAIIIPRLRQVVRSVPGSMSPPSWVSDSDFSIDRHLRRIALPKKSTDRDLYDLATFIAAEPFDRTRPLWQFTVVEGLSGYRAAVIQKLHHTIADGESGVQLSLEFLDFERDVIPPAMPDIDDINDEGRDDELDAADAVRTLIAGTMRIPVSVMKQVRELLADPTQILPVTSTLRNILAQLSESDQARSPLWTKRSTSRHLETASAPFTETKAAAKHLGGTLNTAFLTIASEAASRYHVEFEAPVEALRASMAISTRTEESGANAFSLVRMLVPTGEMTIDERFFAIKEAAETAVEGLKSTGLDQIATFASTLPTSVVCHIARQQSQTVDFATSNVKGSPVSMYLAGAKLLANYPVGPLSGVAFNLTLLSYLGRLDMGLNTDPAAIKYPDALVRALDGAVSDFVELAPS